MLNTSSSLIPPAISPGPSEPDVLASVHWYAAYTSANRERRVAAELERRSIECFLPLYSSVRRWKDRRVKLQRPLFPGYVFVHFLLQDRLRVLQIPGVVRFVGFNCCAAPVPDPDMARIRSILSDGVLVQPHPFLTVGRRVRVKSGLLTGVEGILLRRKNKLRFIMSLELIHRSVALEVEQADIEPLDLPCNAAYDRVSKGPLGSTRGVLP